MVLRTVAAEVVVHAEEAHLPRRDQVLVQDAPVVVADRRGGRPLVEAGVGARVVDAVVAEGTGQDPVEG